MSIDCKIKKVWNGYILESGGAFTSNTRVFKTIEELFDDLLMRFEGRSDCFNGDSYGRVIIQRQKIEPEKGLTNSGN